MKKLPIGCFVLVCLLAIQQDRSFGQTLGMMPQLRRDQVWISSIPTGLSVYFASDTTKKSEDGGTAVYNQQDNPFFLLQAKYLKGKTPILLDSVSAGEYIVGVKPVDLLIIEEGTGTFSDISFHNFDPTYRAVAMVTPIPLVEPPSLAKSFQLGKFKKSVAVYGFTKNGSTGSCVVILATDRTVADAETASLYPTGDNYQFDDTLLKDELVKNKLFIKHFEPQIPSILSLLHRGGKVIAGDGNTRFLVELVGPNTWSIRTEAKINGQFRSIADDQNSQRTPDVSPGVNAGMGGD